MKPMIRAPLLAFAALALAGALVGCPGEANDPQDPQKETPDAGPGGRSPTDAELDAFVDGTLDAFCALGQRCFSGSFPSEAVLCKTVFGGEFATGFDSPGAVRSSTKAGHIAFDGTKVKACLAAIGSTMPCELAIGGSSPFGSVPECAGLLTGLRRENESCVTHEACTDGLVCFRGGTECGGKCVVRGTGCEESDECLEGQHCEDRACVANVVPPGAKGEPCSESGRCQPGLECDFDDLCADNAPKAEGEPCQFGGACKSGLVCAATGMTSDDDKCLPVRQLGESCTALFQCGGAISSLICDVEGSGKCVQRGKAGTLCGPAGDYGCDPLSAGCDTKAEPPVCKAFLGAGAECETNAQCGLVGSYYCESDTAGEPERCVEKNTICSP